MRSLFHCQHHGGLLAKALYFLCRSDVFRLSPLLSNFSNVLDVKAPT